MTPLNINRIPYMGIPMAPSYLTLSGLERSKLRPLGFRSPISRKEGGGVDLTININRRTIYGDHNGNVIFDLE